MARRIATVISAVLCVLVSNEVIGNPLIAAGLAVVLVLCAIAIVEIVWHYLSRWVNYAEELEGRPLRDEEIERELNPKE